MKWIFVIFSDLIRDIFFQRDIVRLFWIFILDSFKNYILSLCLRRRIRYFLKLFIKLSISQRFDSRMILSFQIQNFFDFLKDILFWSDVILNTGVSKDRSFEFFSTSLDLGRIEDLRVILALLSMLMMVKLHNLAFIFDCRSALRLNYDLYDLLIWVVLIWILRSFLAGLKITDLRNSCTYYRLAPEAISHCWYLLIEQLWKFSKG